MATTTTNYGFDVPTSSDLVKNGATQIALLGQDLDTFLFRPFTCNGVLNSAMNVWQRGTSVSISASTRGYTTDRWETTLGSGQASTISRQLTNDTTNLPNIQYCTRFQRNSGQTGTAGIPFVNTFETVNSIPYAGKAVVLSFYARKGADFSPTSSILTSYVITGTGTDQNPITAAFTGSNTSVNQNNTLTTTWQRFTLTGTMPTNMTQLAVYFAFTPTGTASTNDYFEITGVQLEVGNQSSPYTPATPTYATELAACQRYYWRMTASTSVSDSYPAIAGGVANSTTSYTALAYHPVPMRTVPSSVDFASLVVIGYDAVFYSAASSLTMLSSRRNSQCTAVIMTSSGLTANRPYLLQLDPTTGLIGFSAEL
jgi:hypothetical protein